MAQQSTNLSLENANLSNQDEPAYRGSTKPKSENWTMALFIAAFLPLLDGYYITFLTTGLWQQPAQTLAFGLSAFSGAACVVTAMQLRGSLGRRMAHIGLIYIVLAFSAILILAASPFFESMLPANLNLFTAVFLIGLALQLSGESRLQRFANHLGWTAVVKAMIIASLLHGIIHGFNWHFSPNFTPLPSILLAVLGGFSLTAIGVLLGCFLSQTSELALRPMRLGATVSILILSLNVLGLGIPSAFVLGTMIVGIVGTILMSVIHKIPRSQGK